MNRTHFAAPLVVALALTIGLSAPVAAVEMVGSAKTYSNCTALNKAYPHGVAKPGARDKVSGSSKPVTNFKVSASLYSANKSKDRDKDGVACEKR